VLVPLTTFYRRERVVRGRREHALNGVKVRGRFDFMDLA
jgi:hypothetical protein